MWVCNLIPDGPVVICDGVIHVLNSRVISDLTPEQVAHMTRSARWDWIPPPPEAAKKAPKKAAKKAPKKAAKKAPKKATKKATKKA